MRPIAPDLSQKGVRSLLVGGALGTAGLHVAARGLGLATTLILAVLLGPSGYGAYAWAIAWIAILRIPAALGRDRLVVREVAKYSARSEWGLAYGVLRDSLRIVLAASLALTAVAAAVALGVNAAAPSPLLEALAVGLVLLPIVTLMSLAQSALQGLHRVLAALMPDALLRPLLFVALLGVATLVAGSDWRPESALLLQAVAGFAALAATAWLLRAHLPAAIASSRPEYDSRAWTRSGLTLAANSGLAVLNQRVDVLLVGVLIGAASAGVYAVAAAAAALTGIAFMALAAPLSPIVARLYAAGETDRLARSITAATRAAFLVTLAGAAALAAAGTFGLGLLGHTFTDGAGALALLCLAAVVNSACAANTLVLVMTGHERAATGATAVGAGTAVLANLALIPVWGLAGAGVAMVISTVARNVVASRLTWTRLGLDTTPLGRRRLSGPPSQCPGWDSNPHAPRGKGF
jgi:O-antigen/teichoic acid export membrane protein